MKVTTVFALLNTMQILSLLLIVTSVYFFLNENWFILYIAGTMAGFLFFRYAAREEGKIKQMEASQ